MLYESPQEVLYAFVYAYGNERNIEKTLSCVTNDIEWIGTEKNNSAKGKIALKSLMEKDIEKYPKSFDIEFQNLDIQMLSDEVAVVILNGMQTMNAYDDQTVIMRATVSCVKQDGCWLIANLHVSVPNIENEKKELVSELEEIRKKEKTLLSGIPGGVAIYRLKKNGVFITDYVSEGLAKMCDYETGAEFQAYLKEDALINLVPEDIPLVQKAIQRNLETEQPVSVMYRIYKKNGGTVLQRLDANLMNSDLSDDDIAMWYAVHTIVSDEAKEQLNSLKHLQMLVDRIPCGISLFKVECDDIQLTYVNDAFYRTMEINPEESKQYFETSVIDMVHPDDQNRIIDSLHRFEAGEDQASDIVRIRNGNGEWVWYNITGNVDERIGNKYRLYVAYLNCNELVLAQQEREEKYEEMLRLKKLSTQDAMSIGIFNLTKNLIIESDSKDPKIQKHLQGVDIDEILKRIWDDINFESDFPKTVQEMMKRYEKGETRFRVRYCMRHGFHWVESTFDLLTNPYTGDVEATGVMQDVSEAVRAELVVNKLLETDYDSIATINIGTGIATPFTISSREVGMGKVINIQEKEPDMSSGLEVFFRKFCAPEDAERIIYENSMNVILENLKKNPFYESIYSIDFGNGLEHKRVIYAYLDENKVQLICAVQNFTAAYEKEETQKKKLSAALQEANAANRAKTAFLSRISHDMRTPLNGILGLTTLLKESVKDKKDLQDLYELELSGEYLLNLINDTLDVSRIESGKLELHPTVCDGKKLFDNAIGLAKRAIDAKHIQFSVNADHISFTQLYVDTARVNQVIMNVLGNAAKFTPEGGKIDLSLRNLSIEDGVITDELKIRDTGIGMSKEFLPHVFEAFEQEDAGSTSATQGTGLGMAITKQLLHLMGGDISVESELGKGTCFTIILKMEAATEEQIRKWNQKQKIEGESTTLQGKRALLCEDHPLNTQIACRLLEAKDMIVEHAENGKIGVQMFMQSSEYYYDVVLMDIRMPIMDGMDAARAIRSLERRDSNIVPIIAMTANAFAEDIHQTKEAGMDAHLSKPIQKNVLYDTLEKLI